MQLNLTSKKMLGQNRFSIQITTRYAYSTYISSICCAQNVRHVRIVGISDGEVKSSKTVQWTVGCVLAVSSIAAPTQPL